MSDTIDKTKLSIYVIMPFSQTTDTHTKDYWDEHFADFLSARIKEGSASDSILSTVEGGPRVSP